MASADPLGGYHPTARLISQSGGWEPTRARGIPKGLQDDSTYGSTSNGDHGSPTYAHRSEDADRVARIRVPAYPGTIDTNDDNTRAHAQENATHRARTGALMCPTLLPRDDSSDAVSSAAASWLMPERPGAGAGGRGGDGGASARANAKLKVPVPTDDGPGGDVEGDAGPPSSMSDSLAAKRRPRPSYADRKSTRLNSSHSGESRMPSSA